MGTDPTEPREDADMTNASWHARAEVEILRYIRIISDLRKAVELADAKLNTYDAHDWRKRQQDAQNILRRAWYESK